MGRAERESFYTDLHWPRHNILYSGVFRGVISGSVGPASRTREESSDACEKRPDGKNTLMACSQIPMSLNAPVGGYAVLLLALLPLMMPAVASADRKHWAR